MKRIQAVCVHRTRPMVRAPLLGALTVLHTEGQNSTGVLKNAQGMRHSTVCGLYALLEAQGFPGYSSQLGVQVLLGHTGDQQP